MQYKHFSIEEREIIQEMWWQRKSLRSIAQAVGRSPSSVSRELRRNFPPERQQYTPRLAHERALVKRKCRGRTKRLKNETVRQYVIGHLTAGWSPEQIAGRISAECSGERISHEAIYQFIYAQFHRQGYGRCIGIDLRFYLKRAHRRRVPHGARRCQRIRPPTKPSIEDRPHEVDTRSIPGHWESDTVESRHHGPGLNTLVERTTGFVCISRLLDRTSGATAHAITARLLPLPEKLRKTVTFDNGSENWEYLSIEQAVGIKPFFAHSYASWERGTNENTNGLIRWYFPKGTDFASVTDGEIRRVEDALNNRPRKRLGYKTPAEVFYQHCSSVALRG